MREKRVLPDGTHVLEPAQKRSASEVIANQPAAAIPSLVSEWARYILQYLHLVAKFTMFVIFGCI